MEHHRLRKYRGPETWARVRKAYEAGESGPSCALRFDVGLANLRKKARNEGWDRKSQALKIDLKPMRGEADPPEPPCPPIDPDPVREPAPPSDPRAAVSQALQQAERLMSRGEGQKALQNLKAAETYVETLERTAARRILTPEEEEAAERERQVASDAHDREVWDRARSIAQGLLSEDCCGIPAHWGLAAFHWRARVLGPETARADFVRGVERGWAAHHWDADGALKPLPKVFQPAGWGASQFLWLSGKARDHTVADLNDFPWPPACETIPLDDCPIPAQPEAGEPQAEPAEPPPPPAPVKPKLSFEERVRLASGKSGPESRPRGWG